MYLDADILVAILQGEDASEKALRLLEDSSSRLIVSDLAAGEVASAVSRLVRTNELSQAAALDRLAAFDDWRAAAADPLEIRSQDVRLADRLVRRFELGLRMPDAIHLAVCQSRGLALATFDRRMARAAESLEISLSRGLSD